MKEIHDQYKEFADAYEPLKKHKKNKGKSKAMLVAKMIAATTAATVAVGAGVMSNADVLDPIIDDFEPIIDVITDPAINSGSEDIEVELIAPSITSASATYSNSIVSISLTLEANDASSFGEASIILDQEQYVSSIDNGSMNLIINKQLSAGTHNIDITIPYTLGDQNGSLTSSLSVTVEAIEPEITSAYASYNKGSDTITISNKITINDALSHKTYAYLPNGSGYNYYRMNENGSITIPNSLPNGTYQGYILFKYEISSEQKELKATFSFTVDKQEEIKEEELPTFIINTGFIETDPTGLLRFMVVGSVNDNGSGATNYQIDSVSLGGGTPTLEEVGIDDTSFGVAGFMPGGGELQDNYKITINISYKINGQTKKTTVTRNLVLDVPVTPPNWLEANGSTMPYDGMNVDAINFNGSFQVDKGGTDVKTFVEVNGDRYELSGVNVTADSISWSGSITNIPYGLMEAINGPGVNITAKYIVVIDGTEYESYSFTAMFMY